LKYIAEFRDPALARGLAQAIAQAADPARRYQLMEFCGGHTHVISRYGIEDLLPPPVVMIHGPGCPVCVLPMGRIDMALGLAEQPEVTLCTYGDMIRVPGSKGISLLKAKAAGADVRMVYSAADALQIAQESPDRQVIFFAIGFETTTPPTAVVLKRARAQGLKNFSVFCNHVLTPPAIKAILDSPEAVPLDGFVGPAHVSAVIGSRPFEHFTGEYRRPVVVAGFEPLDVLQAILMLVKQINEGRWEVENEYRRAVTRAGNEKAQAYMDEVFELRSEFPWRGLGVVPSSARRIRPEYAAFDAERRFGVAEIHVADPKGCDCGAILRGLKKPTECKLFGGRCTPESPIGACMVSAEGACAAYYIYRRLPPAQGD